MNTRLKKISKWVGYGILLVLLLLFSLTLLLRVPAVQQYVVDKITTYLSEELKTEVRIERVAFSFFDQLVFENFYVEDQGGEPLIVAKYLEANFNTGLLALFQKRLELNELTLRHAELNTKRKYGQLSDNLQFIIDYFEQRQRIKPAYKQPGKFLFNVKKLILYDFRFNRFDELNGADIKTHIDRGIFHFKEVNIPYLTFDAKSIQIDAPQVSVRNFEPPQAHISFDSLLVLPEDLLYPDSSFWKVSMERLDVKDGYFQFHNERIEPVKLTPDSILNYRHVEVFDIHALVNDFNFKDEVFQGSIRNLSFYDLSGFVLEPSYTERFLVSNERAELLGLRLQTPHTSLGDTLILEYNDYTDFSSFQDKVNMRLNFKESHVRLDDIMTFAPALENNRFFDRNRRLRLHLDGKIEGSINNMQGQNLNIRLEDGSRVLGNFKARNLTSPSGQQELYLRFQSMNTRIATIRRIIPDFDLPPNFNKLGYLYYSGRLDMVYNDFILSGKLRSQLGDAAMDLQLNRSPKGLDDASYSGKLSLNNFDLQAWTENNDFGKITLSSEVQEGRGLTGKTADARLTADIESFEYRGYSYENAKINGRLNQRLFKGDLALKDDHIALDFKGKLDYTQDTPLFDFEAAIERLHLNPLNLAQQALELEGRIDLRIENDKPAEMIGRAFVQDFKLRNPEYEESIDSMRIRSDVDKRGIRTINVVSKLLDADVTGDFDFMSLPNTLIAYLHRNLPSYAQRLKLKQPEGKIDSTSQFIAHLSIKDAKNFSRFLVPKLDTLKDIELVSYFNNQLDELELELSVPSVTYDSMRIEATKLVAGFQQQTGKLDLDVHKIVLKNGKASEPLALHTDIAAENLDFNLQYAPNINNLLSQLDLNGQIQLLDSVRTRLALDMDDLSLLSSDWQLDSSNYIEFRDKEVEVGNFLLTDNQDRSIRLNDIGNKGLNLLAQGFQFGIIDTFWNYPILDFGGPFRLQASVGDVFDMKNIRLGIQADSFLINGDNYGNMTLDATAEDLNSSLRPYISITKDTMQLSVKGLYNLPNFTPKKASEAQEYQPNYFNVNLNVSKYPLAFLDYFIGHSISNTTGTINGKLFLKGFLPEPKISGYANVLNGATTIDFLQSRFYIHNQKAIIDDDCICADNGVVTDMNGNKAYVQGGITHQFLKKLGLDVRMTTANDQFVALNTKKGDNDVFYGRGLGSGTIWFSGPFSQTDIVINAVAGRGTKIVIPVSYDKSASENRFITFTDPNQTETDTIVENVAELRGVQMDMGLTLTDVAEIDLVFDEQAGDIIRGRGKGNVQIYLDRTGEMTMYGDYTIEQGEYLFTLQNIVNKPFTVRRGGTIKWTGDPFNANIDLRAEYKGLSTPVAGLIQEYLGFASSSVQSSAHIPTDVDLLMHLRGQLLKPTIDFDLSFPRLQGNLKTYAENKVRTLKQDQNALNRQVFGLIVLGQFIPSELTLAQSDDIAVNTMSEFLANQLSILLTDFFSDILDGNKVISSIDVDLAYNRFGDEPSINQDNLLTGEQYQFIGRANLLDDRWIVSVGPSIVNEAGNSSALYGHDIVLEYFMNKDRTVKLRVSNVIEPTLAGGSTQQKTAAGISYEKEFDTFREFLRGIAQKDVKVEEGKKQ